MKINSNITLPNLANSMILTEYGQSKWLASKSSNVTLLFKYETYFDPSKNNVIVAEYCGLKYNAMPNNVLLKVYEGTPQIAYDYLTNVLNTSKDAVIHWIQVFQSASGYIIHFNMSDDYSNMNYFDIRCMMYAELNGLDEDSKRKAIYNFCETKDGKAYLPDFVR